MAAAIRAVATCGLVISVWIVHGADTTLGAPSAANTPMVAVAPSGDDATCARGALSRPCATFTRAYASARCGDLVEVAGGSYGDQHIIETPAGSACTGNPIVFRPAPGTRPTIQYVSFGQWGGGARSDAPDNLVLRGFRVTWGLSLWGDAVNVTLDRIDGGSFLVGEGATNVTIRNSDWGPCTPSGVYQGGPSDCRNYYPGNPLSGQPRIWPGTTNLLLEGNTFHDMPIDVEGHHWECLFVSGGTNVVFRGNRFFNCQTSAISVGDQGNDASIAGTWLFENNWFGVCPGGTAGGDGPYCMNITFFPVAGTITIRFNSFVRGEYFGCEAGCGDPEGRLRVTGNIFGSGHVCVPGAAYDHNLFLPGPGCGPTDRTSVFGYAYDDERLTPTARAGNSVRAAFAEVARGKLKSLRLVARELSRQRRTAPPGGWKASSLRAILSDRVYLGRNLGIPSGHRPLVSRSLWKKAQRALAWKEDELVAPNHAKRGTRDGEAAVREGFETSLMRRPTSLLN